MNPLQPNPLLPKDAQELQGMCLAMQNPMAALTKNLGGDTTKAVAGALLAGTEVKKMTSFVRSEIEKAVTNNSCLSIQARRAFGVVLLVAGIFAAMTSLAAAFGAAALAFAATPLIVASSLLLAAIALVVGYTLLQQARDQNQIHTLFAAVPNYADVLVNRLMSQAKSAAPAGAAAASGSSQASGKGGAPDDDQPSAASAHQYGSNEQYEGKSGLGRTKQQYSDAPPPVSSFGGSPSVTVASSSSPYGLPASSAAAAAAATTRRHPTSSSSSSYYGVPVAGTDS